MIETSDCYPPCTWNSPTFRKFVDSWNLTWEKPEKKTFHDWTLVLQFGEAQNLYVWNSQEDNMNLTTPTIVWCLHILKKISTLHTNKQKKQLLWFRNPVEVSTVWISSETIRKNTNANPMGVPGSQTWSRIPLHKQLFGSNPDGSTGCLGRYDYSLHKTKNGWFR